MTSDTASETPVAQPRCKRWPRILLAAGAVVAIIGVTVAVTRATTGQSTQPGPTANAAAAAPVSVAATTSAVPTVVPNNTGYLSKKVGERAGLGAGSEAAVEFWITKITVDSKCNPYSQRKPGTHSLILDMTVKTHQDDGYGSINAMPGLLNEFAFSSEGPAGVKNQAEWDSCHPEVKRLPNVYALNSTYTGQIALATADSSGKLQLNGAGVGNVKGWEWQF